MVRKQSVNYHWWSFSVSNVFVSYSELSSVKVNYHRSNRMHVFFQLEWIIILQNVNSHRSVQVIFAWCELSLVRMHVFVSYSELSSVKVNYHRSECKWITIGQKACFCQVRVNYHWWKWIIIGQHVCFCQLEWIIIGQSMFSSVVNSKLFIVKMWFSQNGQNACFCQWEWIIQSKRIIGQKIFPVVRMHVFVSKSELSSVKVNYHRTECNYSHCHHRQNACFCQLEWIIIGQSELSPVRMHVFVQLEWIIIGQNACFCSVRMNYHRSKWIIIGQCKMNYHWSESMFLSVRVN